MSPGKHRSLVMSLQLLVLFCGIFCTQSRHSSANVHGVGNLDGRGKEIVNLQRSSNSRALLTHIARRTSFTASVRGIITLDWLLNPLGPNTQPGPDTHKNALYSYRLTVDAHTKNAVMVFSFQILILHGRTYVQVVSA